MRIAGYLLAFLLVATAWGQTCLPYNRTVTIQGALARVDENGYREWTALRPDRPICTVADPNDETTAAESDVGEFQVLIDDQHVRWNRVRKLIGHKVKAQGKLSHAVTGYHRTKVMIALESAEPSDASGRAALDATEPQAPPIRNVAAYDIVVRAGERLRKEAIDAGSSRPLIPVDAYAPHWLNGGDDIVYVNCRDGYKMSSGLSAPNSARSWDFVENTCTFDRPDSGELVIRIHCARRQ